jgi:D-beta-D-heptose 7-phosphate kinase/D-beta-D-heptose 1-phosphate adenosyltransferase
VVGDAILDQYVFGEVERISPEAPVQVLRARRREFRTGGAGSVVTNLIHLDADVSFFSVRGDDAPGRQLALLFADPRVSLEGFVVEEGRPTTVKTRHMGYVQHADRAMQQLLRVDDEVRTPLDPASMRRLVDVFQRQASRFDAVLVSDYHKGLLSAELLASLRAAAPSAPFLVDPAIMDDYSLYREAHLISPNRYEAERASGIACEDLAGCACAAEKLARELQLGAVALTMDRDGIYLHEGRKGGIRRHFPTRARRVADVTGAGDMVLSVLGLVRAAGGSLADAVELANVAAGLEVRRVGVVPVPRAEILHELRHEGHPGAAKIKKLADLLPIVQDARERGRTVVFTNGCFDLLHRGHHHLLNGAAAEGDILIVAVNSDASVRKLKGPGRPSTPEEDRMLMLANLEVVSYVVSFDEDTPIPLLEAMRPDVLVKGEEYRQGVVVGREVVEGYGGRIAFVSELPGYSTTTLLGALARTARSAPGERDG